MWLAPTSFYLKGFGLQYPTPYSTSLRIAFETQEEEEEEDIMKIGKSHNPKGKYFKHIKDSLLIKYNVKTTKNFPVNYGGIVIKEALQNNNILPFEETPESINKLQRLNEILGFINLVMVIKNVLLRLAYFQILL